VAAASYFTDGHKLGLRKGDFMFVTQFSTALAVATGGLSIGVVTSVTASSAASIAITLLGT
jgi:hypothetical protein